MMPLALVSPGEPVQLISINGRREMCKRLADLGLTPGTLLQVVQGDDQGALIVAFKDDARLAVGRGLAHHILVKPANIK
jgi:Fe2+ transport system protein FeoA